MMMLQTPVTVDEAVAGLTETREELRRRECRRHDDESPMPRRLKLAGRVSSISTGTDQIDHLTAELRQIRRACLGIRKPPGEKPERLHQTGSTSSHRGRGSANL